jgi:hypothetical protein
MLHADSSDDKYKQLAAKDWPPAREHQISNNLHQNID